MAVYAVAEAAIMFGYIKPETPYLYIKDDTLYKALYCGVCKSIGGQCGQVARLALTYDVAFFSALTHNMAGEDVKIEPKRCVAHWIKKRPIAKRDRLTDFAACLNAVLAYYKLLDDVTDEKKGRIKASFFKKDKKRADKKYPLMSKIVAGKYAELRVLEKENCDSLDRVAEPFAMMLKELADYALEDKRSESGGLIFYYLGKWIYLVDALDDYDKDVKKGNYNPLYYAFGKLPDLKTVIERRGQDVDFAFSCVFAGLKENLRATKFYFNHDLIDNVLLRTYLLLHRRRVGREIFRTQSEIRRRKIRGGRKRQRGGKETHRTRNRLSGNLVAPSGTVLFGSIRQRTLQRSRRSDKERKPFRRAGQTRLFQRTRRGMALSAIGTFLQEKLA